MNNSLCPAALVLAAVNKYSQIVWYTHLHSSITVSSFPFIVILYYGAIQYFIQHLALSIFILWCNKTSLGYVHILLTLIEKQKQSSGEYLTFHKVTPLGANWHSQFLLKPIAHLGNSGQFMFPFLSYLHLVLLFWNHVLTCASVIFKPFARVALSVEAKYFCLWNFFSNSHICRRENEVRGFFRLGGVLFW